MQLIESTKQITNYMSYYDLLSQVLTPAHIFSPHLTIWMSGDIAHIQ